MTHKDIILKYLPPAVRSQLEGIPLADYKRLEEIRLRANKPLLLTVGGVEYGLDEHGLCKPGPRAFTPSAEDIASCVALVSRYSLYAYENELRLGYLTLPGGHRVGFAGKTVLENGRVKTMQAIGGLNIRLAHESKGCADDLMPAIALPALHHTMIISPPAGGKTTLLRDMIRQLSSGFAGFPGVTVGLVDERSEIAGCYQAIPQNDVGPRTDVLDGCPKAEGMLLLLRSLSPRVIAVDELGGAADAAAVEALFNAGVTLICTVHGANVADVAQKPGIQEWVARRAFGRYIVLSGPERLARLFGPDLRPLETL